MSTGTEEHTHLQHLRHRPEGQLCELFRPLPVSQESAPTQFQHVKLTMESNVQSEV